MNGKFDEIRAGIAEEYLSREQNHPWILAFSGGKDSTLLAHLVFEALLALPKPSRTRPIYFCSNDTLVENPPVAEHMALSLQEILRAAKILNLPIDGEIRKPKRGETFWDLLIGKGYPTPKTSFRWCTDRLKIQPTSEYIKEKIADNGNVIILMGVRKDESITRKNSIEKHKNLHQSNLTPHSTLKGALIYRPIMEVTTDEVWEFLASNNPPWGGTHARLINLYRDAGGGECPVVISPEEAPGCGTNSSRFGCWVCTVITKDRSLQGFVDTGKHNFQPLLDFRDKLIEMRDNPEYRQLRRRNGKIEFKNSKHITGPFTIAARQQILEELLQTQSKSGLPLISQEEINFCRGTWAEDILKQDEQDKQLPSSQGVKK